MHQTRKGKQFYFDLKAHVGSDAHIERMRAIQGTAASVVYVTQTHHPLHADEEDVFGDSGYQGTGKRR